MHNGYKFESCHTAATTLIILWMISHMNNSAWRQVLTSVWSQSDHVQSPEEASVWARGCSDRLLSQRGLALIAVLSFGQKKQTEWEREHFRVTSNFSQRTRCENSLNLKDAHLFRGCAADQHFPCSWLTCVLNLLLLLKLLYLRKADSGALLCHTSLCRHERRPPHAAFCLTNSLQCNGILE